MVWLSLLLIYAWDGLGPQVLTVKGFTCICGYSDHRWTTKHIQNKLCGTGKTGHCQQLQGGCGSHGYPRATIIDTPVMSAVWVPMCWCCMQSLAKVFEMKEKKAEVKAERKAERLAQQKAARQAERLRQLEAERLQQEAARLQLEAERLRQQGRHRAGQLKADSMCEQELEKPKGTKGKQIQASGASNLTAVRSCMVLFSVKFNR